MVCLYEYVWIDADGNLCSKTSYDFVVSEVEIFLSGITMVLQQDRLKAMIVKC